MWSPSGGTWTDVAEDAPSGRSATARSTVPIDTPAWARDAIFYQIFPDRFAASDRVPKPGPMEPWDAPPTVHGYKGGDLLGIAEQLDELADLGITALYLTPVFASASNHRYHTDDYLAVDPLLGGDAALRELLDAAHARGMRVVLDGVFNHCGRGFWPFHHVAEAGAASPYRDWFHLDEERLAAGRPLVVYPGHEQEAEIRRLAPSGMGAGRGLPARARLRGLVGPAGAAQAERRATPRRARYLLDVAEHWLRFGIDGWRLDVAEEIDGDFWAEFRERCRAVRPGRLPGGRDLAAQARVAHRPAVRCAHELPAGGGDPGLRGRAPPGPAGRRAARRVPAARRATATARRSRRELERLAPAVRPGRDGRDAQPAGQPRRAAGAHRVRRRPGRVRLATLLQMTLPGAPCIYYGDEVGMEGHQDPLQPRCVPVGPGPLGRRSCARSCGT